MRARLRRLLDRKSDRGASAVEYGLLVAAIAAVIIVIVFALGRVVKESLFEDTCQVIKDNSPNVSQSCQG